MATFLWYRFYPFQALNMTFFAENWHFFCVFFFSEFCHGWMKKTRQKSSQEKVMLADLPLFKRIFLGLHQSPKIMTTGTKEVFFCLVFLPPTKRRGHFFFVWYFSPNENKNTQPFYALLCFCFFLPNNPPIFLNIFSCSDFSSASPDLCKSNLCLNSEARLSHHCCGSGNDINRTEDLIEAPWILILGET